MSSFASPIDHDRFGSYDSPGRLARARAANADDRRGIASLNGIRDRIGGTGARFEAEPGRYHLYFNKGCPFCHRVEIGLALLGLEQIVSVSYVDDERDGRGWAFRETHGPDLVNGFTLLSQAYEANEPNYLGHISVPVLWDRRQQRIVSTDSGDILTDLALHFTAFGTSGLDLYPEPLRDKIDELNDALHYNVNFGFYLVGLAQTQTDYDAAIARLFGMLETLETRLISEPYLFGGSLTTSDIRLWVSLARFDAGYYPIFRANLKRLTELPRLWEYARRLYALEPFARHTSFERYRLDYVRNFPKLSPGGILPAGPVADWSLT